MPNLTLWRRPHRRNSDNLGSGAHYLRLASALLVFAVAGCAELDLGPQPDDYVGQGKSAPKTLTDPDLNAVLPVVPGDNPAEAADLPGMASSQPAATNPATTQATVPPPEAISIQDAILVSLQNNPSLRVQKINVPISRTGEEQARSQFDPTVNYQLQGGTTGSTGGRTDNISGSASVNEFLPTGTTVNAGINLANNFYTDSNSSAGLNLSVTQSLLRGAGLDVNLASLRQSQLNTKITQYELRGFTESLVEQIENTYWDLVYAERQLIIVQDALDVSEQQLTDTTERIRAGRLAPSERPAAVAEVESRKQILIGAENSVQTTRLRFLQLLAPGGQEFWNRKVALTTLPFIPPGTMDSVDKHAEVALRFRPEINQTRLQMQRGDLQIVATKNGLLPRLDLFLTLGKTGLAESFGDAFTNVNGPSYAIVAGVRGDWEPINRSAQASYLSSQLSRQQLDDTYNNLVQSIEYDVRSQYLQVDSSRKQIDASKAARVAQETKVATEKAQMENGVSGHTSLTLALAQRDLLQAQLTEVQSVTSYLKALVTLYRLDGTLLFRKGLDAPGAAPAPELAWKVHSSNPAGTPNN